MNKHVITRLVALACFSVVWVVSWPVDAQPASPAAGEQNLLPDRPKLAVIPVGDRAEVLAVAALMEVALGEDQRLELLGREAFDDVLTEASLQLALAEQDRAARRRAFTLLGADLLVVLRNTEQGQGGMRMTVVHAATGLQTADLEFADQPFEVDAVAERFTQALTQHLTADDARLQVVALPAVIDGRLVPTQDGLAERLHSALRQRLLDAGLVLMDFDSAQNLRREMRVRGADRLSPIGQPWFVQTRIVGDLTNPDDVQLLGTLQIDGSAAVVREAPASALDPFADDLTRAITTAIKTGQTEAPELALDELVEQIKATRAAGQPYAAIDLAETLLLHRPDDEELLNLTLEVFREAIVRTLSEDAPVANDEERMAVVVGLVARACVHADMLLELLTPTARSRWSPKDEDFRSREIGFGKLHSAVWAIGLHRWGDRPNHFRSELPEPLRSGLAEHWHPLLRRHARRLLASADFGTPPGLTFAVGDFHDLIPDPELWDLRVALYVRLFDKVITGPRTTKLTLDAHSVDPAIRPTSIAAMERRLAKGGLPLGVVSELERWIGFRGATPMSRRSTWVPPIPDELPPHEANTPEPQDEPVEQEPEQPPADDSDLPTIALHRIDLPRVWIEQHQAWHRGAWGGIAACGPHGDLIWAEHVIKLVQPDRKLRTLLTLSPEELRRHDAVKAWWYEPVYDGQHVWAVLPCEQTLLVRIDPATGKTQRFTRADGLPPSDAGASLAVLDGGRLVLTGAFGKDANVRTWSLMIKPQADRLELETILEAASAFVADGDTTFTANSVGRSRVIRSTLDPSRQFVVIEMGIGGKTAQKMIEWNSCTWGVIDPVKKTAVLANPYHADVFRHCTVLPDRILYNYGTLGGVREFTVEPHENRPVRLSDRLESIAVFFQGWELRFNESTEPLSLFASPDPSVTPRRVARLKDVDPVNQDELTIWHTDRFHVSEHHGVMLMDSELYLAELPKDLDGLFARGKPAAPYWTVELNQGVYAYISRPYHNAMTFDEALAIAKGMKRTLALSRAELQGNRFEYGRRGAWLHASTDKRGRITEDDLLPVDAGRYGVRMRNRKDKDGLNQLYGVPRDERSAVVVRWEGPEAEREPEPEVVLDGVRPPVIPLPPGSLTVTDLGPDGTPLTRTLTIGPGISMAMTELTWLQYNRVMRPEMVSHLQVNSERNYRSGAWVPMELTERETLEFCQKLSETTGQNWRLPTEEEWEYACRAGTTTLYSSGDTLADLRRVGWCSDTGRPGSAGGRHRIMAFEPNRWGFYDMHGNYAEWTATRYIPYPARVTALRDQTAESPPSRLRLMQRGGAWFDSPGRCTASFRRPGFHGTLRVVLDQRPDQTTRYPTDPPQPLHLATLTPTEPIDNVTPPDAVISGLPETWTLERIEPAEYRQRLANLGPKADLEVLERDRRPSTGLLVGNIVPGGQAERAGIKVGDVITHINDQPHWLTRQAWPKGHRTMRWTTQEGVAREAQFEPGMVGVGHVTHDRPELWYLQKGQRHPAWDREVTAALAARQLDPVLAQEAWARAFSAGYPFDEIAQVALADKLARSDQPHHVEPLLQSVKPVEPGYAAGLYPEHRIRLMLAAGLFDLMPDHPAPMNRYASNPQALYNHWPDFVRPQPFEQTLTTASRQPLGSSLSEKPFGYFRTKRRSPWLQGRAFTLAAAAGISDDKIALTDVPVGDFECFAEFTMDSIGRPHDEYASQFTFAVYDARFPAGPKTWTGQGNVLAASLRYAEFWPGYVIESLSLRFASIENVFSWGEPQLRFDDKTPHTLRLVRIGNRGAIYLNGRRILLTPLDPTVRDLAFHIQASGVAVQFKRLEINRLSRPKGAE